MTTVGRTMTKDFRPEIAHVQTENLSLAHGPIPTSGGPDPPLAADRAASDRREPPPEIRVFAVEFDRPVEAADRRERAGTHREVATVQNRAQFQPAMDEQMRRRRDQNVVQPNQ